jgi:beta-1,4-mannosyltransferase
MSFYLYALVRIILQILQIVYLLGWKYRGFKFVLIQNPPSIPNLFAIWLTSFIAFYKIYIDFHNYGYTILALKIRNRIINKIAEKY